MTDYVIGSGSGEFVLAILGIAAAAAVLITLITAIFKPRARRLDIMAKALESDQLDAATKQMLVAELTRPGPIRGTIRAVFGFFGRVWSGGRPLVVAGWLGLFLAIGFLGFGDSDMEEAGIPLLLGSFAILTVPFALREYDRHHAHARD